MKQSAINQHILQEIESAQHVIARHDQEHPNDSYRPWYVIGVLTSTLEGMAGLSKYSTHASCFDPETTEAIKHLLETINQK